MIRTSLLIASLQFAAAPQANAQVRQLRAELAFRTTGEFTEFRAMAVNATGHILATQPADRAVLLFNSTGKQVAKFGRVGSGPGDFSVIGRVGVHASGFWIDDPMLRRVTLVSGELKMPHSTPLPVTNLGSSTRISAPGNGDTMIVHVSEPTTKGQRGNGRAYYAVPSASGRPYLLGRFTAAPECRISDSTATSLVTAEVFHCIRQFAEVSSDGSRIVILSFDRPNDSAYRVTAVKVSGDTIYSRRIPFQPIPLSRRVADSILSDNATNAPPPIAAVIRRMKLPAMFPPVTQIVAGSDGTTWLAAHTLGATREWTLSDLAGRTAGTVSLPTGFRGFAATQHQFWGVERDNDGVPELVSYRVR
jgi:hypothetical protein